jgi:predicted peroxiredoxin
MDMTESRDLTVVITHGIEHEMSSVALTIARGGINAGLRVSLFLTSSGVDLVRKRGVELTHVPPLDSVKDLLAEIMTRGGTVWACPPCVKTRGYEQADLLEGVVIAGAAGMHKLIAAGGATLSF